MRSFIHLVTLVSLLLPSLIHTPPLAHAMLEESVGPMNPYVPQDALMTGPLCLVYPLTTKKVIIDGATPGVSKIDIFEGPGGDDFGWLGWNGLPTTNLDSAYLRDELRYPQMSLNDYTNALDSADHILNIGDYVASLEGINFTVEGSDGLVTALVGREIIIPVWDTFFSSPQESYHISSFALVRIDSSADIDLVNKTILATYLGPVTLEQCPYLTLTKSGPVTVTVGSLITYTLTLTNSGNLTATNLVITDAVPANATYLSGGTLVSNVVSWTVPSLPFSSSLTRTFSVTASQTITNSDYRANADGDISASGIVTVTTTISSSNQTTQVYLPVILKN